MKVQTRLKPEVQRRFKSGLVKVQPFMIGDLQHYIRYLSITTNGLQKVIFYYTMQEA